MEIPLFTVMTAAEFQAADKLPLHPAWMACHFASYGLGLSNVPKTLPPGSMLMLNDRIPINGHNPQEVAKTLCHIADTLKCDSILLDFQRAGYAELPDVIQAVLDLSNCPVGISAAYAAEFGCPVLVPPILPHITAQEALSAWKGREIWLELSAEGTEITVTEEGSQYSSLHGFLPDEQAHRDEQLHCHYQILAEETQIVFHLARTSADQSALVQTVTDWGVTKVLAFWQEQTEPVANATGSAEI